MEGMKVPKCTTTAETMISRSQVNPPKLSIITVTFNAGDVLEKTLESIFNQTFDDYELVIIDGNSTDNTIDIIRQNGDKIARWLSEPDDGIYDAMNKGLASSRGEYVHFLNAGDYYADDRVVEDVFEALDSSPTLIYGDITILRPNGTETHQKAGKFCLNALLRSGTGVLCHQAMFVKRLSAPLYDCKYRFKAELNWYFDLVESAEFYSTHVERTIVCYSLGGFGHKNFIRNRLEWVWLVYKRFGLATVIESKIVIFLVNNSRYRYPVMDKFVRSISHIRSFFRRM